jgi:hypothetical protein
VLWEHPSFDGEQKALETGYHLITETAMFNIYIPPAHGSGIAMQPEKYIIRDALEVPLDRLKKMQSIVSERLIAGSEKK